MAGIFSFLEGIKFNFANFFAFWIFNCCVGIWLFILIDTHNHDSPHTAEIRTAVQTIMVAVVFYFYGASQNSKKKDDTIQTMIEQTGKKDETIKTLTDAGTTTTTTTSNSKV